MALTKYISFHWESHDVILMSGYPMGQVESRRRAAYLRLTATAGITPPPILKLLLVVTQPQPNLQNLRVQR